jgi:hypothetical protein
MTKKSWREILPVHPAADLFPLLAESELREQADDIAKHGLREKVDLYFDRDGKPFLIDGRNRLDALALLGKELFDDKGKLKQEFQSFPPPKLYSEADCVAYVIGKNIRRRHLTAEQRQNLLITLIVRSPEKSDRQIGKAIGVDHKTVGRARAKGEDVGRIPHVKSRTDTKGRKQPVKPRGRTQKTKLEIFERSISGVYNCCEIVEDALEETGVPRDLFLTAKQKADAKRQLQDAIALLQKCLALVAKAELRDEDQAA